MEKITALQAAKLLGTSLDNLKILKKQGLIHAIEELDGVSFYSSSEITRIKSSRSLTISEEATQINNIIQQQTASFVNLARKSLSLVGGTLLGYALLVAILTASFIVSPVPTAQWLGIVNTKTNISLTPESRVLGAE